MDIQLLREFIDLAFTLNFSETAERVFISQSTLSKHIIFLEKELGVQLFVRSKQSVRLTPVGMTLRDKFKKVIEYYDEALSTIRQEEIDLNGSLRIGFLDAAVRNLLTQSIHNYNKKYPNMKISLVSCQVGDLVSALKNDAIDIALSILFPNSPLPQNTYFKPLYNDGISAVVSQDNPLAKKNEVLFEELLQYPIILPSPHQYPFYASIIRELVENSSVKANIICDFSHVDTALIMVESGIAVSILPSNISNNPSTASFIKIKDCNPVLQVGVMWKKNNHSTGITEFVDTITNFTTC